MQLRRCTGRIREAGVATAVILLAGPAPVHASPCAFDRAKLTFSGTPVEQARCLLKPVARWGKLGQTAELPPVFTRLLGTRPQLDLKRLSTLTAAAGVDHGTLARPVSRARAGSASAPLARYFVIHDTSSPWYGDGMFPAALDTDPRINNLSRYLGPNAVAHAFINRTGGIAFGHDFAVPWRATKREGSIGTAAKGLFLHVENVQPRRRDPAGGPRNDAIAPDPGLSPAQYRSLALLYVVASHRAGSWLVPAYHAALDDGISDGHDDPQNFDLRRLDSEVGSLVATLTGPQS